MKNTYNHNSTPCAFDSSSFQFGNPCRYNSGSWVWVCFPQAPSSNEVWCLQESLQGTQGLGYPLPLATALQLDIPVRWETGLVKQPVSGETGFEGINLHGDLQVIINFDDDRCKFIMEANKFMNNTD